MKNAWESYGVTRRGGEILAARVENDGARLKITSLTTSQNGLSGESLESGRLFFGVDGSMAIIKKIEISTNSLIDPVKQAEFEIQQTLLEGADQYYFNFMPEDVNEKFRQIIAIAYHKKKIDMVMGEYTEILRKPSGFKLNAVALVSGYLTFCRREPGILQILLDIDSDGAILAIIEDQSIRAIDSISTTAPGEFDQVRIRNLTSEIKLMVTFHLNEIFRKGVTIPPSKIILSGGCSSDQLLVEALKERFSAEIISPRINKGYLGEEYLENYESASQFLIPLGLAVE